MNGWREWMRKYLPEGDITDSGYATAYNASTTMLQVLKQCEGDFSRENIMRQVANLHDLEVPLLLPGIKVNTSPTNFHPIRHMQLQKWSGEHWERFGDVIEGANV
jgi:branched-chain amino acid transport system substrate-binding protein